MQKNVASQKWIVFAFNRTNNTPQTGDSANITANLRIDGGSADGVDDTNPTELEDGYYAFDLTQAETNGDYILICPASSTANIQVIGVPGAVWTTAPYYNAQSIDASGRVDVIKIAGTTQTANDNGADINAILVDTAEIGAAGAGLTAIPWNSSWDAEVQSEVADALDVAVPGSPTANSINERVKAIDNKLPSLDYLMGTSDATGALDSSGLAAINAEVDTALDTAIPGSPAPNSINERIKAIDTVTDDMKMKDTTISSITTPDTVFVLTNGLTADDDPNYAVCSIYDTTGSVWCGPRYITDYVHATKTVTVNENASFTLQAGDRVVIWNTSYAPTVAGGGITAGDINAIADQVWDEAQTDHTTEGSTGEKQNRSDRIGR